MMNYLAIRKYVGGGLLVFIVLSSLGGILWYRLNGSSREAGEADLEEPLTMGKAQMITRDFRHVETRLNRTMWILEASVAEIFENRARLRMVKITYFGGKARPVVLTGQRGRVDLRNWNAVLTGDVRAVRDDGSILETRRLIWEDQDKTLRAPLTVKIKSRNFNIRGKNMVADINQEWVKFSGGVTMIFHPPADFFESAT